MFLTSIIRAINRTSLRIPGEEFDVCFVALAAMHFSVSALEVLSSSKRTTYSSVNVLNPTILLSKINDLAETAKKGEMIGFVI